MWMKCATPLVLVALLAPMVRAQIPGAAPAAPAAAPGAVAPAAAPAAPFGPFAGICAGLAVCKAKCCASPLGGFINNAFAPVRVLSGGILGNCCPLLPTAADLAAPSDSPAGAAAQIKADEAGAKIRRANVRYLGTVDCRYWPEATLALIGALRADRNECVRLEAAFALSRGCCCNKATIQALNLTVTGSDEDGKPPEVSDRVRAVAHMALLNCLSHFPVEPLIVVTPDNGKGGKEGTEKEPVKPPPNGPPTVLPPVAKAGPTTVLAYYQQIDRLPTAQVVANARRALDKMSKSGTKTLPTPSGDGSVLGVIQSVFNTGPTPSNGAIGGERATAGLAWLDEHQVNPPMGLNPMAARTVTIIRPAAAMVPQYSEPLTPR